VDAVQVSVKGASSCALSSDGQVRCWGSNDMGQLGNGTTVNSAQPTLVTGLDDVVQVTQIYGTCGFVVDQQAYTFDEDSFGSAGHSAACALRSDSSVWCWGAFAGRESPEDAPPAGASLVPVRVFNGTRQISAGIDHTCLLLNSGETQCWGSFHAPNYFPEVGRFNDTADFECVPFSLAVPADTVKLVDGRSTACALSASGTVNCQGWDQWGTLGRREFRFYSGAHGPGLVLGLDNAVDLAMGRGHVCAALADHSVKCWGLGDRGQLGVGQAFANSPFGPPVPVAVSGLP